MTSLAQAAWMIVAMTLAAVATILAKSLTETLPVVQILWLRLVMACALFWPIYFGWTGRSWPGMTRLHALRAAILIGMTGLWFLALSLGPVSQAAAISYTYPVMILVFAAIFFGQRIQFADILSLILSFSGILVVFRLGWSGGAPSGQDLLQMAIVLASSVLIAIRVSVEKVMTASAEPVDILLGSMLIATVAVLPVALLVWAPVGTHQMLLMAGLALTATLSQLIVISLVQQGAWSAVSIFAFWEVLAAITLAVILFGEDLSVGGAIGAALIVAGGMIVVIRRD